MAAAEAHRGLDAPGIAPAALADPDADSTRAAILENALVHVFRHRVQWRIRGHVTPDVWFEVG
jgi:hypothetical protein